MKMRNVLAILFAAILGISFASVSMGTTVIVSENFDSYANTAAMQVVWGAAGAGTLDPNLSFSPFNSAAHPGGTVNTYQPGIGTIDASATQFVALSGKIYDDAVQANDRITIGLRGGPFPLFEMGRYNSFDIAPGTGTDTYGIRAILFSNGISPNWVAFDDGAGNTIPATQGWHTYKARFNLAGLTVTLDLNSNGTIDGHLFFAGDGNPHGGFSDLRFGGPSNSSSTGGGANFDDISLKLVPEPSTLLLLSLTGLGLAAKRRR